MASLAVHNTIRIFKINKKKEGNAPAFVTSEVEDFPKQHKSEIVSVAISPNGKFIMSAGKDTTIVIWTLKGMLHRQLRMFIVDFFVVDLKLNLYSIL